MNLSLKIVLSILIIFSGIFISGTKGMIPVLEAGRYIDPVQVYEPNEPPPPPPPPGNEDKEPEEGPPGPTSPPPPTPTPTPCTTYNWCVKRSECCFSPMTLFLGEYRNNKVKYISVNSSPTPVREGETKVEPHDSSTFANIWRFITGLF